MLKRLFAFQPSIINWLCWVRSLSGRTTQVSRVWFQHRRPCWIGRNQQTDGLSK